MKRPTVDQEEIKRRRELCIQTYGGLVPYFVEPYSVVVSDYAKMARSAFGHYDTILELSDDNLAIFGAVHEALIHSAGVSKFFFPPKTKDKLAMGRASQMRAFFYVTEESPLNNRSLRNCLEHIDERLDTFALRYEGVFLPTPLIADHSISEDQNGTALKALDPMNQKCVILGEVFEFGGIRQEIERIATR